MPLITNARDIVEYKELVEKLLKFMSAKTGMFDFKGCAKWILKNFKHNQKPNAVRCLT